jgi:hypothetical protein
MAIDANPEFFLVHIPYINGRDAMMKLTPPQMTFSATRNSCMFGYKKTEWLMRA